MQRDHRVRGTPAKLRKLVGARIEIQRVIQDDAVWCWAACAEMALGRWQVRAPQCAVVHRWLPLQGQDVCDECCHGPCARSGCPERVNSAGCTQLLHDADLQLSKLYAQWRTTASATTDHPADAIRAGIPVVVGVTRGAAAHMYVAMAVMKDGLVGYLDPDGGAKTEDKDAVAAGVSLRRAWPLVGTSLAWTIEGEGADEC